MRITVHIQKPIERAELVSTFVIPSFHEALKWLQDCKCLTTEQGEFGTVLYSTCTPEDDEANVYASYCYPITELVIRPIEAFQHLHMPFSAQ